MRAEGPRTARRAWTGTRFGGEQRVPDSTHCPPKPSTKFPEEPNVSNHWKNLAIFSNHWKKVFQ